jgi:hypothetical protein
MRWSALRAHLRTEGVANIPLGLLRNSVPNTPTRPEVPLIAYYDDVKQVSLGRHSPKDLITVLLAVAVPILALAPAEGVPIDFRQWSWQANVVVGLLLLGVVGLVLYVALRLLRDAMTRAKGPLGLSCEELNLTLPGRGLQTHWRDVYTATCVRKPVLGQTRFFCRTYVRVELNESLSARLHVDKDDCAPLAKTMRALIVAHRTHTGGNPHRTR